MFQNKVVIVTGAAQGIGKEIATQYAKSGANVVLADVNANLGENVCKDLVEQGYSAFYIPTDVGREKDVSLLMTKTIERYKKIDILVNNAGIFRPLSPYDLSLEQWDEVINTNLRSVFLCSREAAKFMRLNERGGAIVSMASTRAKMSEPHTESYAASKGGIVALTHALACSFAPDHIRVNCISPGWIETGDYNALKEIDHSQHFSGRVGRPEDIAKACFYLTDERNDFVTGIDLTVDGGMTKKMIYEE
ncbi:NAD(P)-dependent dehydrogenase (short-subunit alcohol dehydrogenase family) [Lysinibacillus composti]|uniref:SDR family oxidoreductase n=1 Tax=Lysinibacillus composti TaxID=720633 RepID=A0A3N9UKI2_9BACI|nr:glucose 1-dehydrogenase [Lysinibacillus composti]MBM7606923.1 NAD(P)-dependent dehydrogenase (short-subunit alcohol dehydrogenase family) [Lysinibacillus composti]RQW76473.1 SDR family oxidoreductase [Lysinibacillus composti]